MIDTHAHLNFPEFAENVDEVIKKSLEKGVQRIIIPGSQVSSSGKAVKIAQKNNNIFAAVGIHPHYTEELSEFSKIEELAGKNTVVAIGETGLDYFRLEKEEEKERQKELFLKHIELAEKIGLPLILHNRDSNEDFLEVMRGRKINAVVHCFTTDVAFAEKVLGLGFLISFTGIITFDKTGNLEKVIREVPLEKIMVETDAPYLAPAPYRGQKAEPWMVREIIQKIADLKGLSFSEAETQTDTTAKNFFKI